jgi:uncharacterized protein (DUF1684 family)
MGKILKPLLVIGYWVLVIGCSTSDRPTQQQIDDHKNDVETWYNTRIENLKSRDGWLNLVGLFWLNEGINSFGSDEANDIVFPQGKIAPKAGYFMVKGGVVTLTTIKGAKIMAGDKPAREETLVFHPDSVKVIRQSHGALEWHIIRRDDKVGIRLRDLESEAVKTFKGIERFPVEYSWNVKAKFEPAAEGATIEITNVLGQTTAQDLAGVLTFNLGEKEYHLSATGEGKKLFVVFADSTNGKETYPAGKFVYVDRPDSAGVAYIDFNKSYNPPCAFTDFATCPLPPRENFLAASIMAGEKNYDMHKTQTK